MNSEAVLTETWIVWIFNPVASIIKSSSCYESDSRYTKHYQQLWRYHNHVSGLMPLTNSYLTTILVHMLWHSGELHILAPLALLFQKWKWPLQEWTRFNEIIVQQWPITRVQGIVMFGVSVIILYFRHVNLSILHNTRQGAGSLAPGPCYPCQACGGQHPNDPLQSNMGACHHPVRRTSDCTG